MEIVFDCIRIANALARFRKQGDRYAHGIFWRSREAHGRDAQQADGGAGEQPATEIMRSCEGNGRDGWPCSPPLQDLVIEEQAAGSVALGVGRAGGSHWSSSFQSCEHGLRIEHACRTAQAVRHLRCCYRLADGWQLRRVSANRLLIQAAFANDAPGVMEIDVRRAAVSLSSENPDADMGGADFCLQPTPIAPRLASQSGQLRPQTILWSFDFRCQRK